MSEKVSSAKPLTSLGEFLLGAPLYAAYQLGANSIELQQLYGREKAVIDGYCPFCGRQSTFNLRGQHIPSGDPWNNIARRYAFEDDLSLTCTRKDDHVLRFKFMIKSLIVQKIGQYPSLADTANDESKKYRTVLSRDDASELHKAIGLAAHGVGIGSFVYLRRIFERLVFGRFNEFREEEGWENEDFFPKRMNEKIDLLRDHLPPFMVANSKLYSILSVGIHELSDETCLAAFDMIKGSITIILEEDKKKKEELDDKRRFEESIRGFEAWEARQEKQS